MVVPLFGSAVLRKRTTSYRLCDLIRLLQETPLRRGYHSRNCWNSYIPRTRSVLLTSWIFIWLHFETFAAVIASYLCHHPTTSPWHCCWFVGCGNLRGMDVVRIAISVGKPKNLTNSLVVGLFHRCLQLFNFHIREIQMIGEPCYFDAWPSDDSLNLFWIIMDFKFMYTVYVYICI